MCTNLQNIPLHTHTHYVRTLLTQATFAIDDPVPTVAHLSNHALKGVANEKEEELVVNLLKTHNRISEERVRAEKMK